MVRSLVARIAGILLLAGAPSVAGAQFTGPCTAGGRPGTRVAVAGVFVGGNAALYEYFRRAWWSGERAAFHVDHDWDMEFRDQDKLGHALGGYHLTRVSSGLLRAACVSDRKAVWIGAAYAAAFQLQIEVWDGYQAKYGFSPPDLLFNTAGAAWAVAQHERPVLRAFTPTFSYARTEALLRAPEGSELRPTVDYAGQTYWMSVDVESLLPASARPWWPGIARVSVGRSITDWVDPASQAPQRAHPKIVLSLDLDPARLPGNHPVWNVVKQQLSYYRFPAPALVLTPSVRGVGWYR